jgi:serine/threonine-protein kinase
LDCSSPESILEPTNRTPAGDQYSLGCILYFCLAGRYAFAEGSAVEKMMAHQFKDPTPLKEIVPETPEKLAEIVHKLMRKKPEDRFRGTDDVADELQPLAGAAAVAEAPPAAAEQKPSPRLALSTLRDRTVRRAQIAASGVVTPPASPYPQAPNPAPAPPVSTPAPKAASAADSHSSNTDHRPMPTRQLLEEQDEAEPEAVYTPPPGYVAEGDVPPPMSPIFFTVLGMGVMLIAYMALTMLRPF